MRSDAIAPYLAARNPRWRIRGHWLRFAGCADWRRVNEVDEGQEQGYQRADREDAERYSGSGKQRNRDCVDRNVHRVIGGDHQPHR